MPRRLEGLDYTLAVLDEAGRIDREVFEVVTLATRKQRASVALAIGAPGPELDDFLTRDGLAACLPPKMRESSFRRARLGRRAGRGVPARHLHLSTLRPRGMSPPPGS